MTLYIYKYLLVIAIATFWYIQRVVRLMRFELMLTIHFLLKCNLSPNYIMELRDEFVCSIQFR